MSKPLRVLYYNWVDYRDEENRGGGVSVYQRNLVTRLAALPDTEYMFLSAGISHDLPSGAPRWEQIRHGPDADRTHRFEIVNSAVLSPAHHSFGDPAQISHPATEAAFFDFIEKTGPYDVVHFNNLEGVPTAVLGLKARWPGTRVILSLHNYYPFCPQVNLWAGESHSCDDFRDGEACVNCLPHKHDRRALRLAGGLAYRLKCAGYHPGSRSYEMIYRSALRIGGKSSRALGWLRRRGRARATGTGQSRIAAAAQGFADRRREMVALVNRHCDRVLCVSDAVRRLAEHHGISGGLLHTSYIGTREAAEYPRSAPRHSLLAEDGTLSLGYLGYLRRDKGFCFLLDALEALPDEIAARLRLVIAAAAGGRETMRRIDALGARMAGLRHIDGYTHDDLDAILAPVAVGLVPVLWHDNLPQVAIEMHARHIPLLTSDMGGAQELGRCPAMVFPAGDIAAFHDRLRALLAGQVDMAAYWRDAMEPVGMDRHMAELLTHYRDE